MKPVTLPLTISHGALDEGPWRIWLQGKNMGFWLYGMRCYRTKCCESFLYSFVKSKLFFKIIVFIVNLAIRVSRRDLLNEMGFVISLSKSLKTIYYWKRWEPKRKERNRTISQTTQWEVTTLQWNCPRTIHTPFKLCTNPKSRMTSVRTYERNEIITREFCRNGVQLPKKRKRRF